MRTEIKQADPRKTTHLIKKYFKEHFGITIKVRSKFYSGGCSLNISYTLGPDKSIIEGIVNNLQQGHFNGMEDIYEYDHEKTGLTIDGYSLYDYKYVFVEQNMSDELEYKLTKFYSDNNQFSDIEPIASPEDLNKRFTERWGSAWNWRQLFYQSFRKRNFVTQDESKINLISVHDSESDNWGIYFIYEVNGVQYNTEEYTAPKTVKADKKEVTTPGLKQAFSY